MTERTPGQEKWIGLDRPKWCDGEIGCIIIYQGSHYILVLKFKDFSRTFKDPEVAFSRTISTEVYSMDSRLLKQHNIYFRDYRTVLVDKNKT